jgi:type VI secretion system secreted protein VgrG
VAKISQKERPISVKAGSMGEDDLLLEVFKGKETLSKPFHFELQMLAEADTKVEFDKLLGQPMTVKLTIPDQDPRYFHGIVSRFSQGQRVVGPDGFFTFIRYYAEVVPSLWLLTRRTQSRIFQAKNVIDILKVVFKGMKVTYSQEGTFEKRDYCVQYRETDFDFASRLMEEEGLYYFFKHTESGHEMVLANTPAKHPKLTPNKIRFEEAGGGNRLDECITSWVKEQEITSGKYTLGEFEFELTNQKVTATQPILETVEVGTVSHKLKVGGNDQLEVYEHPGRYAQRFDGVNSAGNDRKADLDKIGDDGKRTVGIRMQQTAVAGIVIQGRSDARAMCAGYRFDLDEHFDANGSYVLTDVTHEASQEGAFTAKKGKQPAFRYGNRFRCIPFALPFRPARVTPKSHVDGPQTAVVVGPSGDEIFTDKYGRVKVQFHWDRDGQNDASSSCWVRVGTPWAGKQWGMIHIPRIGQEVIVAFEEGDPDQPLIIGSVYDAANMPPYTLPDNKTQSGIKSRSSLKGDTEFFNELRFEDKKDSEDIYFHGQKDFHRVVEHDDDLKVGNDQVREIAKNRTQTIKEGNDTYTLKKGNRVETLEEGDETLTMKKGSRTETLENGSDTLTLKKGARTETLEDGDDTLTLKKGSRTIKVQKDHGLTLDTGNATITVTQGNYNLAVKTGSISIKADTSSIKEEATQSIELKCGGSSIKISPSGVTIQACMVKIEGTGMVQVKGPMTQVNASGMLILKGGMTMIG